MADDTNTVRFEVPVHPLGFTDSCARAAFERDGWRYAGLRTEGKGLGEHTSFAIFERDADGERGVFSYRWVDNQRAIVAAFNGEDARFGKSALPTEESIKAQLAAPILAQTSANQYWKLVVGAWVALGIILAILFLLTVIA